MNDLKELLDREARRVSAEPDALDTVLRRRDRKRRNQRITAGVVGIAVFAAAIWIVTSVGSLDRSETSVPGGDVTGPAETRVDDPEPPPLAEPVQIGTVTRSEAGCALEIVAEPIPVGAGRLTVVNETNRRVAFDLLRFYPEVLTFGEFEAFIASGKPYLWRRLPFGRSLPDGAFGLVQRRVGPGASRTITDNFWPGGTYAIACGEPLSAFGGVQLRPIALAGPIEVETAPA